MMQEQSGENSVLSAPATRYVALPEKKKSRAAGVFAAVLQFLWCLTGVFALLACTTESFQLVFSFGEVFAFTFIFTLAFFLLRRAGRACAVTGGVLLAASLVGLSLYHHYFFSRLYDAFRYAAAYFIRVMYDAGFQLVFDFSSSDLLRQTLPEQGAEYLTMTVIAAALLISAVVAFCTVGKCHPILLTVFSAVLLFPMFAASFFPSVAAFIALIAFLTSVSAVRAGQRVLLKQKFGGKKAFVRERTQEGENAAQARREYQSVSRNAVRDRMFSLSALCAYVFSLLIGAAALAIPSEKPIVNMDIVSDALLEMKIGIENKLFSYPIDSPNQRYSGGIGGGRIKPVDFEFENKPVITLDNADVDASIYLRGWIGKDYYNERWSSFKVYEVEEFQKQFGKDFSADAITWKKFDQLKDTGYSWIAEIAFALQELQVKYTDVSGNLLYVPCAATAFGDYVPEQAQIVGDGMLVSNEKRLDPEKTYYFSTLVPLKSGYAMFDAQDINEVAGYPWLTHDDLFLMRDYSQYVYKTYRQYPAKFEEKLVALSHRLTDGYGNNYEKAAAIQNYLAANYTYSLSVEPCPDHDTDEIEYFLFESRKGYCTYYATAMVLLARAAGIPARYVEGYVAHERGEHRVVLDSDAHAWPEIFIDDLGWLPFEPTTTYAEDTPQTGRPERTPAPVEPGSRPEPEPEPEDPVPSEAPKPQKEGSAGFWQYLPAILVGILLLALVSAIIAAFFLRYRNRAAHRFDLDDGYDPPGLIAYLMGELKKLGLERYADELPTDHALRVDRALERETRMHLARLTGSVEREFFSPESIGHDEFLRLYDYAAEVSRIRLARANPVLRLWIRYVFCPIAPRPGQVEKKDQT